MRLNKLSALMLLSVGAILGTLTFKQVSSKHRHSSWKEKKHPSEARAKLLRFATTNIRRKLLTYEDPKTVDLKDFANAKDNSIISGYMHDKIGHTAKLFTGSAVPRLLVFDGKNFQVFTLKHKSKNYPAVSHGRSAFVIPLLVHTLKEIDPVRFQPGNPPFQVLYTDADLAETICLVDPKLCSNGDELATILAFGSVPKNQEIAPPLQAFPNRFFIECMYDWRFNGRKGSCDWGETKSLQEKNIMT